MQDNDTSSADGNIDTACNTLRCLGAKLPQLAIQMLDMRFAQLIETNILDGFHETDQTRLKPWRQSCDFRVNHITKGLNRPSHKRYIANTQ